MGEEYTAAGMPKLHMKAIGTDLVTQVDLIRNNEFLYTQHPGRKEFEYEYVDRAPKPGVNWYYVRLIQQDGNLAWSSPVWVRRD